MSDLIKLNNITKRNGDIKAFPLSSNLIRCIAGKKGIGQVAVAVDNESIKKLFLGTGIGILYVIDKEEWEKE